MKPPALAQALVAAVAPSGDYEIIAGDLHEEYERIFRLSDATTANRWYWAQALSSIPSFLSYSRSNKLPLQRVGVALIVLGALIAMAGVFTIIDTVVKMPLRAEIRIAYFDAVFFGAILAQSVKNRWPSCCIFCVTIFRFMLRRSSACGPPRISSTAYSLNRSLRGCTGNVSRRRSAPGQRAPDKSIE